MKCEYCDADIQPGTEFVIDGLSFCNQLHRKWWEEQGSVLRSAIASATKPKTHRINSTHWGMLAGLAFMLIASAVASKLASGLFNSDEAIDAQLMTVASEFNKSCPIMVDKDTRLENTIASVGKTFVYNYTLVNLTADQVDVSQLETYVRPRVTNNAKTSPDMKLFRDNEVTLVYRYSDKALKFLCEIKITPDDIRNAQ